MIIGSCLGDRYEILEMIGSGGMATVYRAFDNILTREVAVKVLRQDFALDERAVKRFRREAQSAFILSHPNIVSIYDVGEGKGIYYIMMEYVKGMTLKAYIERYAPVSLEKVLSIMKQITLAISHAHENQIIHRDIKPQNILIDSYGQIKITDFGIAMLLQSTTMTQTNTTIGSVYYLSPEQAKGSAVTYQTDIYSMGILFYELLVGLPPFQGESAVAVALHHIQTPTPSIREVRPNVPQSVENIVLKATAKNLVHRYQSIHEMICDIDECLLPEKLHAPPYRPEKEDLEETKMIFPSNVNHTSAKETSSVALKENKNSAVHIPPTDVNLSQTENVRYPWYKIRKNQIMISICFIVIVIGIILVFLFINKNQSTDAEVPIPDISGMTLEEARLEFERFKLTIDEVIEQNSEEVEEGKVIKTKPSIGTKVKEDFPIIIYISSGMEKTFVENYEGRSYTDLEEQLMGMYKEVNVTEEISEKIPGTILRQTPSAGEEVIASDTILTLVIAKEAPKPKEIAMLDFTGQSLDALEKFVDENNLNLKVEESYSDNQAKGKIISHTPSKGNTVQEKDTITVVVSKGEEEKPPKVVYVQVNLPFDYDLTKEVQEVVIYINDLNHSIHQPALQFDITEDTEESFGGVGEYRVVREGVVIQQKTVNYPNS